MTTPSAEQLAVRCATRRDAGARRAGAPVLRWAAMLLLGASVAAGSVGTHAADSHDDGHASGHTAGGQGKGPKYQGGDRGSSHGSSAHKGGSSHHDGSEGGSKAVESKIFHGRSDHADGGHSDSDSEHTP